MSGWVGGWELGHKNKHTTFNEPCPMNTDTATSMIHVPYISRVEDIHNSREEFAKDLGCDYAHL